MTSAEYSEHQKHVMHDLRILNEIPEMDQSPVPGIHMVERPDSEAHRLLKSIFLVETTLRPTEERVTFTADELHKIREMLKKARGDQSLLSTVVDDTHHTRPQPRRPEREYRG